MPNFNDKTRSGCRCITRQGVSLIQLLCIKDRMNKTQKNIVASWIIGAATLFLALYVGDGISIPILFVGFVICRYLRRKLEAEACRPFQAMSENMRSISAVYYVVMAGVVISVVIFNPDYITYSDGQFLLLLIIIFLPLLPVIIMRDASLYSRGSVNDA